MKKTLVFAMAMAMGVSAVAFAANPFSDVPQGHWAYDAVAKLAAQGVVEGYGDGTFEGGKAITRYEMAQIVAKAMAKGAVKSDDKLVAEFQQELQSLGVRVSKLEKKVDNVKISGQVRIAYRDQKFDSDAHASRGTFRSRLFFNGEVNKNWTYQGMLQNDRKFCGSEASGADESVTFQRAFVTGKYGDFKVTAGRFHNTIADAEILDDRVEALKLEYGKDFKVRFETGKMWDTSSKTNGEKYIYVGLNYAKKAWGAEAGYLKVDETKSMITSASGAGVDNKIFFLGVNYKAKDWKLGLKWIKGDGDSYGDATDRIESEGSGWIFNVGYKGAQAKKVGTWGLYGKYYSLPAASIIANTQTPSDWTYLKNNGVKGYMLGVNWTIAKNMVAAFEWYDVKGKENSDKTLKTMWTQLVFTF